MRFLDNLWDWFASSAGKQTEGEKRVEGVILKHHFAHLVEVRERRGRLAGRPLAPLTKKMDALFGKDKEKVLFLRDICDNYQLPSPVSPQEFLAYNVLVSYVLAKLEVGLR